VKGPCTYIRVSTEEEEEEEEEEAFFSSFDSFVSFDSSVEGR
jgi:hypothetical protein